MSSTKRKQDKPTKSLIITRGKASSSKSKVPRTRNRACSSQPESPQTRRSQRVPKKKVPFSNEIPIPKKRVKKGPDDPVVLSPGPSSSTPNIIRPHTAKRSGPKGGLADATRQEILQVPEYAEETPTSEAHLPSESESDTSEIKIETNSNLESVRLALKDTLESLQTMHDPTINVEIPYFVIKKKKKNKRAKKKKRKKTEEKEKKKKKQLPEKIPTETIPVKYKPEKEKVEPVVVQPEPEELPKENVLDIDQLRRLSADSLVVKYAHHRTVTVPKDKDNTITQSVYTCRMLPSHCFEKFIGIDEDTKQQVTRHLLRHVGELLTMANEGMASKESPEAATNEEEDEAAAFVTPAAKKTTYHVASNAKPFTVSHPHNVNLKRSRYTVIRSSEGKEGTNEVVLLPRGRGFYSYRPPGEDSHHEGITEQSFQSVIDNLLGQASKEHEISAVASAAAGLTNVANDLQPPATNVPADTRVDNPPGNPTEMGKVITEQVVDGLATVSGIPTSVVLLDEKDIQMDVEVSTGARRSLSSITTIPEGVGSVMKLNHTLSDVFGNKLQDSDNSQDVPFPDHNYSHADGSALPAASIHTDSHGVPTAAPISIEESGPEKLDIAPILHSMNQQVSSLIPNIELHIVSPGLKIPNQEPSGQSTVNVSLASGTQFSDPLAAAIQVVGLPDAMTAVRAAEILTAGSVVAEMSSAGVSTSSPSSQSITTAGVPMSDCVAAAIKDAGLREAGLGTGVPSSLGVSTTDPITASLDSVMSPEEEEMLRVKAVNLLDSLLKNQKRRGPFRCQICQKLLTAASTLRAHYRSHAGIKPFQCLLCNATFTRQHSLNYHMMIHNQEARFSCSFCARQFRHANHFREHLRRHTGEEPYGCTDCPARFKTRNTYKRHMRSKHNKIVTHKNTIKLATDESE